MDFYTTLFLPLSGESKLIETETETACLFLNKVYTNWPIL